jgi:hypothetical protein
LLKEFGPVDYLNFSPIEPYNFAVVRFFVVRSRFTHLPWKKYLAPRDQQTGSSDSAAFQFRDVTNEGLDLARLLVRPTDWSSVQGQGQIPVRVISRCMAKDPHAHSSVELQGLGHSSPHAFALRESRPRATKDQGGRK